MKRRTTMALAWVLLTTPTIYADFESPAATPAPTTDRAAGQRPFDLSVRVFFGSNDNVQVVPDRTTFRGKTEDVYAGLSVWGNVTIFQHEGLALGATGALDYLGHLRGEEGGGGKTDDYDLLVISPGLFLAYRHHCLPIPLTHALIYNFRYESARNVEAIGLESHTLTFSHTLHPRPDLDVFVSYAHGWDDFEVMFPNERLNSRDAQRDSVSVGGRFWWDQRRRNVSVTYTYIDNDSQGRNFAYQSHGVTGRVESHLVGPVWGAVEAGYRCADYDGFVHVFFPGPGRDRQEVTTAQVQLLYVLNRSVTFDLFYQFMDIDSNDPRFRSEVHNFGGGVTFRF